MLSQVWNVQPTTARHVFQPPRHIVSTHSGGYGGIAPVQQELQPVQTTAAGSLSHLRGSARFPVWNKTPYRTHGSEHDEIASVTHRLRWEPDVRQSSLIQSAALAEN